MQRGHRYYNAWHVYGEGRIAVEVVVEDSGCGSGAWPEKKLDASEIQSLGVVRFEVNHALVRGSV